MKAFTYSQLIQSLLTTYRNNNPDGVSAICLIRDISDAEVLLENFSVSNVADRIRDSIVTAGKGQYSFILSNPKKGISMKIPNPCDPANGDYIDISTPLGDSSFVCPRTMDDFVRMCQLISADIEFEPSFIKRKFPNLDTFEEVVK